MRPALLSLLFVAATLPVRGGDLTVRDRETLLRGVDAHASQSAAAALQIWQWAEVGYQETQSSALLQKQLADAGFALQSGVAGMPTGFVASAGSAAAAIVLKDWLAARGTAGTIRVCGTPAEEGGAGKAYMVRAGLFDDVDVALHWHAGDRNDASQNGSNSNKSGKFRFHGIASHAASAPDKGRSALDAVEAMDMMANMMREHMPGAARMHYVITRGGAAPNVVPDFAEVFYYVRHPDPQVVQQLWERLTKIAEGAALGTGTTWEVEIIHGAYPLLANHTLGHLMQSSLERVGGVQYDAAESAFAQPIYATLDSPQRAPGSEREVMPYAPQQHFGSTDVGDVSWTVPTVGLNTATWVPGTAAHSWQAAAVAERARRAAAG